MAYNNDNSGVLFKNNKKTKDNQPDYTGNITVSGTQFNLSAWLKTSKGGDKYMSLAVSPWGGMAEKKPQPAKPATDDLETPF